MSNKRFIWTKGVWQWDEERQKLVLLEKQGYEWSGPVALLMGDPNFVQSNFVGFNDDGSLTTASTKAADNTNWSQNYDETFRVRFEIQETAGNAANGIAYTVYFSTNDSTYSECTTTSAVKLVTGANVTDGTAITSTERHWAGGTYVDGFYDDNNNVSPVSLTSERTEVEYCLQIDSASITSGTVYLKVYENDAALDATSGSYTNRPAITVTAPAKTLSGTPEVQPTASGTISLVPQITAGAASVSPTASGTIDLAPKVWLDSDTTLAGATEMTVTAFSDTSITFNHPSSTPTGSLNIGVENRNQGGGDANTGWLAVTVTSGNKTLSGTPEIAEITASGTVSYQREPSGTPSLDEVTSSGSISQIYKPSGTPSIDTITASGVISYERGLSGTPTLDELTASGTVDLQVTKDLSGTALTDEITASGTVTLIPPKTVSGTPEIDVITASGSIDLAPRVWLNATQTLSGATAMTVTSWNVAGTSITFTDPLGGPIGSTNLGVENRNAGGGDTRTGWIAVDITASRTASGTPEIPTITASGTVDKQGLITLTSTAELDPLTSTGEIGQILKYSGTPSIDEVTASGSVTKVGQKELSGTPNIDEITSTGEIGQILKYSGTPSIDEVTASGTVTTENVLTLSGSPSINEITASASLDLAPIVWLNTTQTLAGATKMTVTAWNVAGTSITFTDPIGPPTDSLNLGVENRNLGGGDPKTGWIAVTVNSTIKYASGAATIDTITADGLLGFAGPKPLSGTPSIDAISASGIVNVFEDVDASPTMDVISASGTVSLVGPAKTLSGTPETPEITASGNVVVLPPKTLSGSPQIEEVTASGEARFIPEITSAAAIDQITASGTIIGPAPIVPSGGGGGGVLAGIKLRRHPFEREIEEEIREEVEEVLEEIEEIEEELDEIEEFSAQEVSRVANERLRRKQNFIRRMRKVHKLSEKVAVRQLEARINEMVRQRRRFVEEVDSEADTIRENLMLAMIARERDDIEALLVIIAEVA